jgi:hypothetical protein
MAALRGRPGLREAAQLRLRALAAKNPPELEDWLVGRVAGDAELEKLGTGVFAREEVVASVDLDLVLGGARPGVQAKAKLLTKRGQE